MNSEMDATRIKPIIEAALLASSQPLSIPQLEALFAADTEIRVGNAEIAQALHTLVEDCAGRGIELIEVASGYRFQVRRDIHPWVARLWTERPSRYSRALLETLSLIAYRQPITRGEIEQVRGVAVSSNIIKTLEEREWIRVVGHRDTPGRPALFGTTRGFLDYFNLKSLDELPPLSEIVDLESMDPQLALDEQPPGVGPPEGSTPGSDSDKPGDARDEPERDERPASAPGLEPAAADSHEESDTNLAEAGQTDPEEDRA